MRASIVIAALNEGDYLWKTVQSCVETTHDLDYELIVADDCSTDNSIEELLRRFPQIRQYRSSERRGCSPTKDLGASHARGDVLVFLDGHCKPEAGAIARLVADVEELAGQAIVTPSVLFLDVETWQNRFEYYGHGYRMDLDKMTTEWIGLEQLHEHSGLPGRRLYRTPAFVGCCLAMTRSLYDRLLGFDPGMLSWGIEDIDFGLKAWLMGHAVLHDPEPVVGHRFRTTWDNYSVSWEHLILNQLRMARKNFAEPIWNDWIARVRPRHAADLWERSWNIFQEGHDEVEREREYLMANRVHDELWYASEFGLEWPQRSDARPEQQREST